MQAEEAWFGKHWRCVNHPYGIKTRRLRRRGQETAGDVRGPKIEEEEEEDEEDF
jgi:hypothetical protein